MQDYLFNHVYEVADATQELPRIFKLRNILGFIFSFRNIVAALYIAAELRYPTQKCRRHVQSVTAALLAHFLIRIRKYNEQIGLFSVEEIFYERKYLLYIILNKFFNRYLLNILKVKFFSPVKQKNFIILSLSNELRNIFNTIRNELISYNYS